MAKFDNKQFSVEFLYFVIFTTVTVLVWIGFEVFRALATPGEKVEVSEVVEPIDSDFNEEGLAAIRERLHIAQRELDQLEGLAIENLGKEAVFVATESASIESTNSAEATESGQNQ